MASPRFFTFTRAVLVLALAINALTLAVAAPTPWWVVLSLLIVGLVGVLREWRLENLLHLERHLRSVYAEDLRNLRKELDRG